MHLGDDVRGVHHDVLALRGAQRHVQDGAVLGRIDLLAREHGVDSRPQACSLCEGDEETDGLGCDAVLGVVEVEAVDLERHRLATRRVGAEEVAQVGAVDLLVVVAQRLPLGRLGDGGHVPFPIPSRARGRTRRGASIALEGGAVTSAGSSGTSDR